LLCHRRRSCHNENVLFDRLLHSVRSLFEEQLLALVKQVQEQQAQIVSNQKKIDGKLADLAETIRTARIFSSRSR
jgi:hypothetical protein